MSDDAKPKLFELPKKKNDSREVLEDVLAQADTLKGVIILSLGDDFRPRINGSASMTAEEKEYLMSFARAYYNHSHFPAESFMDQKEPS